MTRNLLSKLDFSRAKSSRRRHGANGHRSQLTFELLEQRQMLTSITVTNLNDSGPGSLRDAIEQANANPGQDDITFDQSIAGGTINLSSGQLDVTDNDLSINGNNVTIDAQGSSRVIEINDANDDGGGTEISDLTITGGDATGDDANPFGGGILSDSFLALENVNVTENTAIAGGGISGSGNILIQDSAITNNTATIGVGGGIFSQEQPGPNETLPGMVSVGGSVISGNSADSGGGIFGVVVSIGGGTQIIDNVASLSGGGIDAEEVDVIDSNVSGNTAEEGVGGGISGEDVNIFGSMIENNSAGSDGGGVHSEGDLTLTRSEVSGNTAGGSGGGVNTAGNATIDDNSNISNNTAGIDGGGINASGSQLSVAASTISGNAATTGGGVAKSGGAATFTDSTIENNTANGTGGGSSGVGGGGVFFFATASFIRNFVVNNSSNGSGAGISVSYGSSATVQESTISGNSSGGSGGGVHVDDESDVLLDFSFVFENDAEEGGGGVYVEDDGIFDSFTGFVVAGNRHQLRDEVPIGPLRPVPLENAAFIDNAASRNAGRQVEPNGPAKLLAGTAPPSVIINNTLIESNISGEAGGGLFIGENRVSLITDSIFRNNTAEFGGAFFADYDSADLATPSLTTISGSTFDGNTAIDNGGALDIRSNHEVLISDTVFINNTALGEDSFTQGDGGAIDILNADLTCDQCTFENNEAFGDGGAISVSSTSNLTLGDSEFLGNTALNAGAIDAGTSTNLFVDRTTFSENQSTNGAGAIELDGDLILQNSTVSSNVSVNGAGGINVDGSFSDVEIVNSTFAQNSGVTAGGIEVFQFADSVSIQSSTIAGNTSTGDGGGINLLAGGNPIFEILNSIVADNSADGIGNDIAGELSADFTLVEDAVGAVLNGANNITGVDPGLGVLTDNGGPTATILLASDSPGIDAGDPAAIAGQDGIPGFDQRGDGFDRISGGRIDLGATESKGGVDTTPPQVTSIEIQDGSGQRSVIREITVNFDSIVTINAGAFELTNSAGQAVDVDATLSVVDGQTQAVLTFSGKLVDSTGSLIDGNYSLRIVDSLISDSAGNALDADGDGVSGNDLTDEFFRLFGDADGDGNVGFFDYALFRNALFSLENDPDFNIAFDANGDGAIDLLDVQAFSDNFGSTIGK